jgi:hypothetical protein
MIWTHITTLDEEVKSIWKNAAGVTLNKVLFAIVRYFLIVSFGFVLDSGLPRCFAHIDVGSTASVRREAILIGTAQLDRGLGLFLARPSSEVSSEITIYLIDNTHTVAGVSQ